MFIMSCGSRSVNGIPDIPRYHQHFCVHFRSCRGCHHRVWRFKGRRQSHFLQEFGKRAYGYTRIRNEFTSKIVFGLEFLIAADILRTLVAPTQQEIVNLGAVVVITDDPRVFPPEGGQGFQSRVRLGYILHGIPAGFVIIYSIRIKQNIIYYLCEVGLLWKKNLSTNVLAGPSPSQLW